MSANPFDQFDSQQSSGNPFDQFDDGAKPKDKGGFLPAAKQAIGAGIKGAGQFAADFIPGVSQDNAVKTYGQSVVDANPTVVQGFSDIADKPGKAIAEASGNAAGSIGTMLGARALGTGITAASPLAGPAAPVVAGIGQAISWGGPLIAAALPSFGGIRERQIQNDPENVDSPTAKAAALGGAAASGAIETSFGPQKWALGALTKEGRAKLGETFAAKSLAGAVGKGIVKGGVIEGSEELVQNPIEQAAAFENPTTAKNVEETLFGGAMGAIGGGVLGGGFGAGSRLVSPPPGQQAAPQPIDAPASAPPTIAGLLPNTPNQPMVVFPDGSTMSGAEAERYRLDQMVRPSDVAPQSIVGLLPHVPGSRDSETLISFPDGSTGTRQQFDNYIASLPENQRTAAMGSMLYGSGGPLGKTLAAGPVISPVVSPTDSPEGSPNAGTSGPLAETLAEGSQAASPVGIGSLAPASVPADGSDAGQGVGRGAQVSASGGKSPVAAGSVIGHGVANPSTIHPPAPAVSKAPAAPAPQQQPGSAVPPSAVAAGAPIQQPAAPDIITLSGGRPYVSEAAAKQGAKRHGATETHAVEALPAGQGFVLRRKAPTQEQSNAQAAQAEPQQTQREETPAAGAVGDARPISPVSRAEVSAPAVDSGQRSQGIGGRAPSPTVEVVAEGASSVKDAPAAQPAPALVDRQTTDGRTVRLLASEADGKKAIIPVRDEQGNKTFDKSGAEIAVKREQLAPVAVDQVRGAAKMIGNEPQAAAGTPAATAGSARPAPAAKQAPTVKSGEWEPGAGPVGTQKKRFNAIDQSGNRIGTLLIYRDADGNFDVSDIATDEKSRRRGVATALMDAAFADTGAESFSLSTGTTGDGTALMEAYGERLVNGKRRVFRRTIRQAPASKESAPNLSRPAEDAKDSLNAAEAAKAANRAKLAKTRKAKEEKPKTILHFLKDQGGLNSTEALDLGGDRAHILNRLLPGLFKKTGMDIDAAREVMEQHGWLKGVSEADQLTKARELISAALHGNNVQIERDAIAILEAEAEERAAEYFAANLEPVTSEDADVIGAVVDDLAADTDALDAALELTFNSTEGSMTDENLDDWLDEEPSPAQGSRVAEENPGRTEGDGRAEGRGAADQGQEAFGLTGQTPEDIAAQEARRVTDEDAAREEEAKAERDRREADAKAEIERRGKAGIGADEFQLSAPGGKAADNREAARQLAGQRDIFASPQTPAAVSQQADDIPPAEAKSSTDDAGAELTANRRNKLNRGLTWADIADKDEALRVKDATKQKVYPRPDYQALIDGGMEPAIAHIVKQVYDAMATAPKTRATPTDADIQAFIAGVNRVMDGAMSWANDAAKTRAFVQKVASRAAGMVGAMRGQPVALSSLGGASEASLLDTVYPDGWKAARSEVTLIGGNKVLGALQPNTDEMIAAMKAVEKGWPAAQEAWQKRGYQVVNSEGVEPSYYEGKRSRDDSAYVSVTFKLKVGRLTRNIDQMLVEGTAAKDAPEVRRAVAERMEAISGKMLLLDKSGHLVSAHDTQEAAEEAARELTKRDGKTTVSDKGIRVEAAERIGPARRMEGEDISSEKLRDTFKFKGVNFGDWMKGDANAKERQLHVNHAYDAFLDLAEIMDVPPEAMSLNGMLGLAIGAQGGGGKMAGAAHFVPGVNEINLTREYGAGSLAHEWGHALDHYFARLAVLTRETEPFLTEHANRHMTGEIRPEIVAKFKAIVEAMNRRPITPAEAAVQQHAATEKSRKNVESWLKAIRRDFESGAIKPGTPNPEAAKKAALEAFDVLSERVRTLNLGDGKVAASSTTALSPAVSLMRDIYKENFGRTYSIDNLKGLQANIDSLAYRVAAKDDAADHVPQMTGTTYAANARKLDGNKGGKAYWSTNLEKFARAFDAFVSDTLEAKAAKNSYLSHAGRAGETVPEGAERTAINQAFAELVQTIETKTDDAGNVAMFSRSVDDPPAEESQKVQAGIEGKSLIDAARFIVQNAEPAKAEVAKKVLSRLVQMQMAGVKLQLKVVHLGDLAPSELINARGYTSVFFDEHGWDVTVWLNGADVKGKVGVDYEIALHEMTHAATTAVIRLAKTSPGSYAAKLIGDLDEVSGAIEAHINARFADADAGKIQLTRFEKDIRSLSNNAFRNSDEVVAWALSSREAQAYLEAIPYKKTGQSLWSRFVESVRSLLGLPAAADTALSEILRVSEEIMGPEMPTFGDGWIYFGNERRAKMDVQQVPGKFVFKMNDVRNGDADMASRQEDFSSGNALMTIGQSVESARAEIAATIGKPQLAILERKGMVKIHADINTMPAAAQRYPDAWGYFDGATVHLVAGNLAKGQASGVFAHEFWHRMLQGLKLDASPLYGKMMERLSKIEKNGAHPEWFRQAQEAIPQEDRGNAAKRLNETAAYAIQQYEADPKSLPMLVRKWAQDMIAAVRAFFMEKFGFVPKNLTAADLAALTRRYITATAAGEKVGGPIGEAMAARSGSIPVVTADNTPRQDGKANGPAGATSAVGHAGAAEQMLAAMDDEFADYGLRVIPGEFEGEIAVGDILPNSRAWVDGRETDNELGGASTAAVESKTIEGIIAALRNIGATGINGPNGYYFGDRVVLVKGARVAWGEDAGEQILGNAEVVGVWRKPTKGLSEVQPNKSITPAGPGEGVFSRAERTEYGRVIVNPSEDQLRNLIASSSEQELRGLRIDGELYVWDAANAIHSQMQRELGLSGAEQVYFTQAGEAVRESSSATVGEASADEYQAAGGMFSRPGIAARFTQSSTETSGESGREYSAAQREMFVRVGRTVEKPSLKDRIKAIWKDAGKRIAQGMVDQFRPLRELGGQAYLLARLSKGTEGAIDAFLHHGKLKLTDNVYDADTSGGAIEQVFSPLQGEADDFLWWVAANRAARLSAEDRENLFTKEDIAAGRSLAEGDTAFEYTLADGSKTKNRNAIYRDALKKFDGFNKNALDIAEKSGLIDGESRKYWEHEFYVPFYRVNDEEGGFSGAHVKKGLVRQEAFKQLKGGQNKLNADLLENTLQNWAHLIDASAKNRAAKATLAQARKMGIARPARQGEKDAVWYMGEVTRNIPKGVEYEDGGVTKVSDGTATIREHGKVNMVLEGEDAPYIMEAITSLQYAGLGTWAQPLTAVKHWLTIGVTASPAFKLRNLIRDSVQAIGTADLSYNPARNLTEGFKATRRDTQKYVSMLASGALIRFGTMEGEHAQKIRRLVSKGVDASTILDSPNKLKAFYGKYLEPGIDAYNELGNRGEEINRAALYEQLMAKGMDHAEAALMARDLMDFSMQGTWAPIRFLTQVVPFMNARMQGLYKLGRASAQDKRRFATVVGAVALFSVMLMLAYEDDDDWKKREDWDRDNNWWFKLGGVAFRVPKPFEIGTIGTLAERGVELFASDEMTGKRFMGRAYHMLADTLAMNPIPQLFKPVIDLYANKNSFTGRPIETMGMERLLPEYRFTSRTTLAARAVSTAGNAVTGSHFLSPVQVDHLVQGYFSWLGAFATGTVDRFTRPLTDDPAQPTEDYWKTATAGFLSSLPAQQSRYVSQMYEQARVLEQAHGTYQHLLKTGRMDEAQAFRRENAEALAKYRTVEHIKKIESQINQRIRKIENSDLTADQKRNLIDIANRQKDAAARRVPAG